MIPSPQPFGGAYGGGGTTLAESTMGQFENFFGDQSYLVKRRPPIKTSIGMILNGTTASTSAASNTLDFFTKLFE
jgi:hypothetical protein